MAFTIARAASALHSSPFYRFYLGQTFSYLGDGLRILAIPLLVFHLTRSATALGLTSALESLPYALVALAAGSLADRLDRRRLMLGCDGVRFVVMALFSILFATGHLTIAIIYVGVAVLSIAGSLFQGALAPAIPYLLGAKRVKFGISTLMSTEQAVNLIAPPLGGALLATLGPLPALSIDALTYLFSQFSIASVSTFGPDERSRFPMLREITEDIVTGWRNFCWRCSTTHHVYLHLGQALLCMDRRRRVDPVFQTGFRGKRLCRRNRVWMLRCRRCRRFASGRTNTLACRSGTCARKSSRWDWLASRGLGTPDAARRRCARCIALFRRLLLYYVLGVANTHRT